MGKVSQIYKNELKPASLNIFAPWAIPSEKVEIQIRNKRNMKVNKEKPPVVFAPITLTLESQAEVDKIFALLNFVPINEGLKLDHGWEKLGPFKSENYRVYHEILDDLLK